MPTVKPKNETDDILSAVKQIIHCNLLGMVSSSLKSGDWILIGLSFSTKDDPTYILGRIA